MKTESYLSTIHQEHLKKRYCIWRWCTTCGNCDIRDRLFDCITDDLKINPEETGTVDGFRGIFNVRNLPIRKKMIENLCEKLNKLDNEEISRMVGFPPFYKLRINQDNFLKFIIMEIWATLNRETDRDERLRYFKSLITNDRILETIEFMDRRYTQFVIENRTELS